MKRTLTVLAAVTTLGLAAFAWICVKAWRAEVDAEHHQTGRYP